MSETVAQHKKEAQQEVRVGVLTISDTRTLENDLGGKLIVDLVEAQGHQVVIRKIIRDDVSLLRIGLEEFLDSSADAILMTGGTGIGRRDVTIEAFQPLLEVEIPGFGEVFRMLSYHEIGSATMLSRAFAGVIQRKVVIAMPGSPAGVRLAMERLVLPEIAHLIYHAQK